MEDANEHEPSDTQSLAQCEKALASLRSEYSDYAYIVSHDLKAPFRQMGGFADLLRDQCGDELDEKSQTFLNHIITSAARGQALLDGLLEFSRVNTRGEDMKTMDLALCAKAALQELEDMVTASEAVITIEDLPTLNVDAKQMIQMFRHLFHNALTYQAQGNIPRITLSVMQQDGAWEFSLHDNGIGFGDVNQERSFAMLRRGVSDQEFPGGLGVGLTIAKQIIERHGGTIWIEEDTTSGACVRFTLPA